MPESAHAYSDGEQGAVPVARLQCVVDVGAVICDDDLPARIHVPGDTAIAHMHELRGAVAVDADAICHRHSGIVSHVQEKLQVSSGRVINSIRANRSVSTWN